MPKSVAGVRKSSVVIGIATYRRPPALARLLESLAALDFPRDEARVVVVDNDASGSARNVVEGARSACPFEIDYEIEPVAGIVAVRNRVVEMSRGAQLLAFLDDDELPDRDWLKELVAVQRDFEADLVAGPVLSDVTRTAPAWVTAGGFFDRPRRPTGSSFVFAGTGNLLIRLEAAAPLGVLFDSRFGLTGGEDTHFFLRAHRAGLRMVWADSALVQEHVPATRANIRWILKRAYRGGTSISLAEAAVATGIRRTSAKANRVARGSARIAFSCCALAYNVIRVYRIGTVRALRGICVGAGMVVGAFGIRYMEYKRPSLRVAEVKAYARDSGATSVNANKTGA